MFGNIRQQMISRNVPSMPGPIGDYGGPMWSGSEPQAAPAQGGYAPPHRGTAQRIAGYLADALSGLAGQQGPYAAMLAQERQMGNVEAMRQRQRADEYTDWQRKQDYERAHPAPTNNDTVSDYEFIRSTLGDEQAQEFLRNKANPPTYRVGPDGQFYRVDVAAPPSAPIGRLTPIEEGGTGNGAGGFPVR